MQLDEQTRQDVFRNLREKLGETTAVVLMAAVPPIAWSQVATKEDVSRLEVRIYRALLLLFLANVAANVALIEALAS